MSTSFDSQRSFVSSFSTQELVPRLRLLVLTDKAWSRGRDTLTVVKAALEGGATLIQLRNKTANVRTLVEEGLALRALTQEFNALFIVNDRPDIALAVNADGVHVGQDDMPADLARKLLGPERILGVSAGNLIEAEAGINAGADYLGVGPIYPTQTKADAGPATGLHLIEELAMRYSIPLVAIGGITKDNVTQVIQAGASGVAVITAVVNAENVASAARHLRTAISGAVS
jgi:thiamine-phosphate pyrophosphorylase